MPGRGVCWPLPASRSTPLRQRQQPRAPHGFGLFPVRSPLLRESSLFLGVREMFQFPRFPPYSVGSHLPVRGCPIRRSPDRRVPAPPRRISSRGHVLLRLQAPRHPPDALLRGSRARPRGACPAPMGHLRDARGAPRLQSLRRTRTSRGDPSRFFKGPSRRSRVEPRGFEPRTSAVQRRRSPS